jgi:uncharacterized RDD family membrane protein YckC
MHLNDDELVVIGNVMSNRFEAVRANPSLQSLWIKRAIAFVVDSLIIGIIFVNANIILALLPLPARLFDVTVFTGLFSGVSTILSLIIVYGYYTFFEGSLSATTGKMLLNLRVMSISGGPMNYTKALVRNLTKPWNWIIGLLFLLDLIVGFVTEGDPRQRFMDTLAGTTVITTH